MKFLKKLGLKDKLRKLGKGALRVADNVLLGGVVTNVTHDIEGSAKGKLDWARLIRVTLSCTIPVVLLIAVLAGWIDVEELKELLKLF